MLAPQLGPGVRVIRGRLARATDSVLVIKVTDVEYLGKLSTMGAWSGEEVSVPTEYISGITERRYSRGRTWLAIGVATAALALTTTIALNGFGTDPPSTKTGGGGQTQ